MDKTRGNAPTMETSDALEITGGNEVDRIYVGAPDKLTLCDKSSGSTLVIEKDSLGDVVLWNIGEAKCSNYGDMKPGDWKQYVCIETAQAWTPVTLPRGKVWTITQKLSVL